MNHDNQSRIYLFVLASVLTLITSDVRGMLFRYCEQQLCVLIRDPDQLELRPKTVP